MCVFLHGEMIPFQCYLMAVFVDRTRTATIVLANFFAHSPSDFLLVSKIAVTLDTLRFLGCSIAAQIHAAGAHFHTDSVAVE